MSSKRDFIYITDSTSFTLLILVYLNQMVNWSKKYSTKVLISSLRFNWYLIVRTAGKFQESLLHVGWTSSKKSAIIAWTVKIAFATDTATHAATHIATHTVTRTATH